MWIKYGYRAAYAYDDYQWRVALMIGFWSWDALQWQFTVYYLRTACLFRMALRATNNEELEPIKKRKRMLNYIEWSGQGVLFAWFIFMLAFTKNENWNIVLQWEKIITVIGMAAIVLFSARHIHIHSKPIEKIGIKTSSTVMTLYLLLWSSLAVSMLCQTGLYMKFCYYDYPERSEVKRSDYDLLMKTGKLIIAYYVFFMSSMVISAFLQILITYNYFRISKKLSAQARQLIAMSLQPKMI